MDIYMINSKIINYEIIFIDYLIEENNKMWENSKIFIFKVNFFIVYSGNYLENNHIINL